MLELFHGSTVVVGNPLILPPTRTLDYGAGFYCTTSYSQAEQWVRRKLDNKTPVGYINSYEIDIEKIREELNVLWFDKPDERWIDFVMANRTDRTFNHDYDVVYGPVANDKVYTCFALYESGIYSKDLLIQELRTYKLVDQLLFHTERSLQFLRFNNAKEIRL